LQRHLEVGLKGKLRMYYQFGFRIGKGTRDVIGMLRIISERTWR
jgi:hypothetical protein